MTAAEIAEFKPMLWETRYDTRFSANVQWLKDKRFVTAQCNWYQGGGKMQMSVRTRTGVGACAYDMLAGLAADMRWQVIWRRVNPMFSDSLWGPDGKPRRKRDSRPTNPAGCPVGVVPGGACRGDYRGSGTETVVNNRL